MQVSPVTLVGNTLRLEPLARDHAAGLAAICDADLLKYHFNLPPSWDAAGFEVYIQRFLGKPDLCPFALIAVASGQPVGMSCYLDIRPQHRGLEIGSTWISRPHQGTRVNPEAKYLMLRHAFEELDAIRVQLKTDGRNLQSQRAIEKLGAVKEGVLRHQVIMPDGFRRDSVMYSIVAAEWPQVKARLEARIE